MKQIINAGGKIMVVELPKPTCGDNEILVKNHFSVISAGTEASSISSSKNGFGGVIKRVSEDPKLISSALSMLKEDGAGKVLRAAEKQFKGSCKPPGYSSSGIVQSVGKNVKNFCAGDRVACGGTGYAMHAESICVPENLACKVPLNISLKNACFATLGAISLNGIRQAKVTLGDNVIVIGLGLIGQISCLLLKACGARVFGIDTSAARVKQVNEKLGIKAFTAQDADNSSHEINGGKGADAVIICASSSDNSPLEQAVRLCRKRGKVVIVGDTQVNTGRELLYEKEISLCVSRSYGPGRYDRQYEEKGVDYPFEYVRWTENRNMQAFLQLLENGQLDLEKLTCKVFPTEKANEAYQNKTEHVTAVLFQYEEDDSPQNAQPAPAKLLVKSGDGKLQLAVIGAGNFCTSCHLPNIKRSKLFSLRSITSNSGVKAKQTAEKYSAPLYFTDYTEATCDEVLDAVLITTRHNLHAEMVKETLAKGLNVYCEKPLALTMEECLELNKISKKHSGSLTVGFNRRFAPHSKYLKTLCEQESTPIFLSVNINISSLNAEHWIFDKEEGGGILVGEGCHFFDLANYLTTSEPVSITAVSSARYDNPNICCTVKYADSSIFNLNYTSSGNVKYPKEHITLSAGGVSAVLSDFKTMEVYGRKEKDLKLKAKDKGHRQILEAWGKSLAEGEDNLALPKLYDGIKATVCALCAEEAIRTGSVISVPPILNHFRADAP